MGFDFVPKGKEKPKLKAFTTFKTCLRKSAAPVQIILLIDIVHAKMIHCIKVNSKGMENSEGYMHTEGQSTF